MAARLYVKGHDFAKPVVQVLSYRCVVIGNGHALLLCRVCDPLEHDGGMPVAEAFRTELNRILETERLAVCCVGGRPVLGELTDAPDQPMFSAPEGLENRLRALLAAPRVVPLLGGPVHALRGGRGEHESRQELQRADTEVHDVVDGVT